MILDINMPVLDGFGVLKQMPRRSGEGIIPTMVLIPLLVLLLLLPFRWRSPGALLLSTAPLGGLQSG